LNFDAADDVPKILLYRLFFFALPPEEEAPGETPIGSPPPPPPPPPEAAALRSVALQVAFERQILKPVVHLKGYRLWV
jgi:hypothetical protein